jgi:hypothetical protein
MTMNLQPIYPLVPVFCFTCNLCKQKIASDQGGFADLNGEPFQAYICAPCAAVNNLTEA